MSTNINRAVVGGRLTRDPELRSTAGGLSVLSFSVASNESRRNDAGEWEERPSYVDCAAFGRYAESLAKRLSRGCKVVVEGRLRWSRWERDGQARTKLELAVDRVELLDGGSGAGAREPQPPRPPEDDVDAQFAAIPSAIYPDSAYDEIPF